MSNPNVPQIASTIGINYAPAILSSRQFRQEIGKVNAAILSMQKTASSARVRLGVDQMGSAAVQSAERTHTELTGLETTAARTRQHFMAEEQANLQAHLAQIKAKRHLSAQEQLRIEAAYYNRAETQSRRHMAAQQRTFTQDPAALAESMVGRRLGWFMSGMGLFGAFGIAQQTMSAVSTLEQATLRIKKVSIEQSADFQKLRDDLIELGIQYGQTADQVMQSAIIWAQAGYRVAEIKELTRVSLLAQTVADMPADESVKLLISALKQYNLEIDQAITVLDKANEVSNNFAITARDVFHALSVTGQMAKNAGIDLDTLVGYIAALAEATGRSGKEIGNALKSIIAFSQRPKSIKFFEEIGVAVVNAEGNYRSFTDVMMDLSVKWKGTTEEQKRQFDVLAEEAGLLADAMEKLTDVERTQLAQAGANLFRRNYFISLMERMADATDATAVSMNSLGSAEREHAIFLESHALKVNQLKAAFAGLAVQIGDSGLLNIMKGVVDGTRGVVVAFDHLPPSLQDTIVWLGVLGFVLGITTLTLRTFAGVGIGQSVISLANLILAAQGATRQVQSMGAAFQVLAASKVVWFWGALAVAVFSAYQYLRKTNQEMRRTIEESATLVQRKQDEIKTIQQLRDEYMKLSEKVDKTEDEKKQLGDVTARIAQLMPEAIAGYDSLGNAISNAGTVATATKGKIAELNREIMQTAETAYHLAVGQAPKARGELDLAEQQRDYWLDVVTGRRTHAVPVWSPIPGRSDTRPMTPQEIEETAKKNLRAWEERVTERRTELKTLEDAMRPYLTMTTGMKTARPTFSDAWLRGEAKATWRPGEYDWDGTGGAAGKEPPTWLKLFSDALKEAIPPDLLRSLYDTEDALSGVRRESELLTGTHEHLSDRLKTLTITQAEYAALQNNLEQQLFLTRREQAALNQQNDILTSQLPHINAKLEEAANRYAQMEKAQNVAGMREAAEAYDQARKAIESVTSQIHSNTRALTDADRKATEFIHTLKTLGTVGYESAWEVEKQLNELKNPFDALVNYIRKARDLEHKREIKRIQDERDAAIRAIEDRRDAFIEASNARIKAWQAELDAMSLERELAKEAEQLAKAQEELAQAQQQLANIPPDVKVWTGSGWAWIQDPAKLAQAQEAVKKAEEALTKIQEDIAYNARRRELQDLIEHEREQQRVRVDSYNKQIEDQKNYWQDRIDQANAWWELHLDEDKIKREVWLEQTRGTLLQSLDLWRSYYNKLREMSRESSGDYAYAGGPGGGGGTINTSPVTVTVGGKTITTPGGPMHIPGVPISQLPGFKHGGHVGYTGLALVHEGEYVIPKNVMRNLRLPQTSPQQLMAHLTRMGGQTVINNVDRSMKFLGDMNLPHVIDASGLVRNLKMMATG